MEVTDKKFGTKAAREFLGDVLVLGLGKSGKACVEYLMPLLGTRVSSLTIAGGKANPESLAWTEALPNEGIKVYFNDETIRGDYDLCIASPGISQFSAFYANAERNSHEIISEVEFAWRESDDESLWIAITGTNGKTTTTALTAAILMEGGFKAGAVGNIGDPCITAVASHELDVYVAEVSSYQLASTKLFAPDVAVVLNITPDHLHWHRTHEAYAAAKWKIIANMESNEGAVAILNATDDAVRAEIRRIRAEAADKPYFEYIPIGTGRGLDHDMREACGSLNAAFITDEGELIVAYDGWDYPVGNKRDLKLKGEHNIINALAAASAALAIDTDPETVQRALLEFAPLEHRIEPCGTIGTVQCFNDSKATNVDATLVALTAFDGKKPIVLLGGQDKGTDLEPLVSACEKYAKAVVCFGEAADRFSAAFRKHSSQLRLLEAQHLEDALDAALDEAIDDDIILLSPACASFDEFSCFEERGDVFKALVQDRSMKVQGSL